MFIDYPHENRLVIRNNKKFLVKHLKNRKILYKEYQVLKFLEKEIFVPKVFDYKKQTFLEEFLEVAPLTDLQIKESTIKMIALILNRLHSIDVPTELLPLVENQFLINKKYHPLRILEAITQGKHHILGKDLYRRIEKSIEKMDDYFNSKPYRISLTHGDLSSRNILIGDSAYIVDWTDCRLDISSCDVAQLFYLLRFNKKQERIFLRYYKTGYIDGKILLTHRLLLLLYDLIDYHNKHSRVNRALINELTSITL